MTQRPTLSLELCCEIQGALRAWSEKVRDPTPFAQRRFGISLFDFYPAHAAWLEHLAQDPPQLMRYAELVEYYLAMYRAGPSPA